MSKKTIARFSRFVIYLAAASTVFSACASNSGKSPEKGGTASDSAPRVIGKISSKDIDESSGVTASKCDRNVLWTHNDSGDDAYIFAIDLKGDVIGTWRVPDAENDDWEDIASMKDGSGNCFLYIGDTGDNKQRRTEHKIYRVPEPVTKGVGGSSRKQPLQTATPEVLRYAFPDYKQDAEALMVHPNSGEIYLVTKRISGPAGVYKLAPSFGSDTVVKLEKVAEVSVPAIPNGLITGGDISPDGAHVALCDYSQGYELTLPAGAANFDMIWQQQPQPIGLGKRPSGESICYSIDGSAVFATSEGKKAPLIEVDLRK